MKLTKLQTPGYWVIIILSQCLFSSHLPAGMISTQQISQKNTLTSEQEQIRSALMREDVKRAMLAYGIQPVQIQQRMKQLTDEEIRQLARHIEHLPAGGGAGLVLFATGPIVLMFELMGLTDLTTTF